MTEPWRALAVALADQLAEAGDLRDPVWRQAFMEVPRHLFVPGQPLALAYSTEAIVTQTRPAYALGGDSIDLPTSSASAPGAVAIMLDRLDLQDGQRVLEIGTGTGYNTGLLCHRVGGRNVYSIDLDAALVDAAGAVLRRIGYVPMLRAGDGHDGIPDGAPYDAILATCAVTYLPPAWIRQLKPSGRVVAPLLGNEAALMVLRKTAEDEVVGRFDQQRISFMPLRTCLDSPLATPHVLAAAALAMAHYGTTTLDPAALVEVSDEFTFFLHLHIPGFNIGAGDDDRLGETVAVSDQTSMARTALAAAEPGRWTVIQRGPRRLWDTIEHATRLWEALGRPGRDRFGITALDRVDRQFVWLDDPDGPYSWPLPL